MPVNSIIRKCITNFKNMLLKEIKMRVHKNGHLYIKNNDSFNVSFAVPKKNFTLRSEPDKDDDTVIEVSVSTC